MGLLLPCLTCRSRIAATSSTWLGFRDQMFAPAGRLLRHQCAVRALTEGSERTELPKHPLPMMLTLALCYRTVGEHASDEATRDFARVHENAIPASASRERSFHNREPAVGWKSMRW